MSNASTFLGSGAAIKSVQRGTISSTAYPATATVTAVDTARSVLRVLDTRYGTQGGAYWHTRAELTNATTVTMINSYGGGLSQPSSVAFELVEYDVPIRSIQHVSVAMTGIAQGSYQDTTITAVDLSKSIVEFRGYEGSASSAVNAGIYLTGALTSSTNLRVYNRAGAVTPYTGTAGHFTIVEFF